MSPKLRSLTLIVLIALLTIASAGCQKLQARDQLNKGVQSYKNGQYDSAIEFFKKAKELDPTLLNARLYLATAYASQYIPGAPSDENIQKGKQAVEEFKQVLAADPNNLSAIDGIGSILFQMAGQPFDSKMMEESMTYHNKHIELKPDDPEPYYWIGVIQWTLAYRGNNLMRKEYNDAAPASRKVKDDAPLPQKLREEFVAKYGANVDNGIAKLEKAIQVDPMYENAMAYLNLLYRQKADQVATPEEREKYLSEADKLVDKVKEIKQRKAEEAAKAPQM